MDNNDASTVILGKDGIIRVKIVGERTGPLTKKFIENSRAVVDEVRGQGKKVRILVDLRQAGKSDTGARREAADFFKGLTYDRIALFGANKAINQTMRYLLNTIAAAKHIRIFTTEAKALPWLRHEGMPPGIKARWLLGVAGGLALLTVVWQQFAAPLLLRLPDDFTYEASVVSYDNFYNEQTGSYSGKTLSDTKFTYQTLGARNGVADVKNIFDVRTVSGDKIFSVERHYGVNQYSREHAPGGGDKDRTGYLFAPANLNKQDFVYWHVNYDQPATMKFQEEESILGLKTYRYTANYHADQTSDLTYLQGVGATLGVNLDIHLQLWIEPQTGYLVKYEDDTIAYFYDLATGERRNPWNHFSNSYSFDSVAAHVSRAEAAWQRKEAVEVNVPITAAVVVILLLVWAAFLSRKDKIAMKDNATTWPRLAALIIGGVALAVLIGWATNNALLIRLHPTFSAMHILTAVNFLIFSVVLGVLTRDKRRRGPRVLAGILLGLVIISELLYFAHYFFQIELGVSALLTWLGLPPLSQLPPVSALCHLLIALAILAALQERRRIFFAVSQILLFIALGLAVFGFGGYVFNLRILYSLDWFHSMALHTAILLIVLITALSSLFAKPKLLMRLRNASKSIVLAFFVLVVMLAAAGAAWQQALGSASSESELRFQADVATLRSSIVNELNGYVKALQGARGLFASSDEVTREEWRSYISSLRLPQNYPGMQGVGFVEMVAPSQKAPHTARIRAEGFPSYSIQPEGVRDIYSSIVYIEPFNEQNRRAFGYDMFSEPVRRQAMERARDTGEATLSGKVTLVQETDTDRQFGMLIYLPVYKSGAPLTTTEQRRNALTGYVYTPMRMTNFLRSTLGNQTHGLNAEIFDAPQPGSIAVVNRVSISSDQYGIGSQNYSPAFANVETLEVANRDITLRFSSLPTYNSTATQNLPVFVLAVGITLSILLAALAFLLSSSRSRALKLANAMTIDLRNERNAAETNQHKVEAILASIGDGVFMINPAEEIVVFNRAATVISGFTAQEAIGRHYKQVLHFYNEQDGAVVDGFIKSALRGKHAEMARRTMLARKNSSAIPVADSAAPVVNAQGGIDGAVVVFRDISRDRQVEKMKDEFLSIASHELRTPMGAIRANISMMLGGDYGRVNKGLVEPLTDVHASTVRLVELVNDLLNAARIEAGRMRFALQDMDIQPFLQHIISSLRPLGKEKGIAIKLQGNTTASVQADPDKLGQTLTNLVGNALKFTDLGSITVSVAVQKDHCEVTVTDTGIGIAPAERNKLFGKFSQIGSQQSGKPAGTGLGLYISRQIMRKMGGDLWLADSKPGKGSTFALSIPLSKTSQAIEAKRLLEKEASLHPDQK